MRDERTGLALTRRRFLLSFAVWGCSFTLSTFTVSVGIGCGFGGLSDELGAQVTPRIASVLGRVEVGQLRDFGEVDLVWLLAWCLFNRLSESRWECLLRQPS